MCPSQCSQETGYVVTLVPSLRAVHMADTEGMLQISHSPCNCCFRVGKDVLVLRTSAPFFQPSLVGYCIWNDTSSVRQGSD